jgi:hypothetical protein
MAIGSYPRVTVQGTGAANNIQNGLGLMVLNPSTNKYEAATAATFSGGGGGGDATAANQTSQITEAQTANGFLDDILNLGLYYDGNYGGYLLDEIKNNTYNGTSGQSIASLLFWDDSGQSTASLLNDIKTSLSLINAELTSLNTALTDGSARVVIQDTAGDIALVNSSGQLEVKTN